MRFEKTQNLLRLALAMAGSAEGLSLQDIQTEFKVSRRTAERMLVTIEQVFPQIERANEGEVPKRWRIPRQALRGLNQLSVDELLALDLAADLARRDNLPQLVDQLNTISIKLKALLDPKAVQRLEPDLELLTEAEGTALRPGPRLTIDTRFLTDLRHAVNTFRMVQLTYVARGTGEKSVHLVAPYGFLYGNRHYLVALSQKDNDFRLFSLGNIKKVEITDKSFTRKDFSLKAYAERSFGVFQEDAFEVVWKFSPRAAPDARQFQFHPNQVFEEQDDGSLIVRFRAGGAKEMCWHLFTWGGEVEVIMPKRLRAMFRKLCAEAMPHD